MYTNKKAGRRISGTATLHRSEKGTPIQPEDRHPKSIITHFSIFCKGFWQYRFFRDEIFPCSALLCGHGFFIFVAVYCLVESEGA